MDMRKRIVLIGSLQILVVGGVLFGLYYYEAHDKVQQQYLEKARSIILTAEATREEMGRKWDMDLFNEKQLAEYARNNEIDRVLAAVPVVTAWRAAEAKAQEGGYQFKTPKFDPRNPKNLPDELEAAVLKRFEQTNETEHWQVDSRLNAIRYFRPIKLTKECMNCHGDPATSKELWGNDKGLDPTGSKMENWKVGEVHGAFEIIQSLDKADAQIATSLWKGGGLIGGLVALAGVLFYWLVTRSVVRPIHRIISGLNDSSTQVSEASRQISSASQQLAASASEQASTLEETSSALEEMSSMTRTTAESSNSAADSAGKARVSANEGSQTVTQLNSAMEAINQSAAEISKIIKVIEEIAFQTNLLALNAAVEAARAGEHGKGFAVVAEEVRNLAQRSAQAARETTQLIADSVNRAHEGSQVAASAGKALQAITGNVNSVAELLGQISSATGEQAQGVEQINSAMGQMNKVTQQNAATAEETASSSEELSAQAETLRGMVGQLLTVVSGGSVSNAHGAGRSGHALL